MVSQLDRPKSLGGPKDKDTCRRLISLGYARSNRVRLYGLELQLVSDPFPHDDGGIAVEVKEDEASRSRTVKLPLSVLEMANKAPKKRSA